MRPWVLCVIACSAAAARAQSADPADTITAVQKRPLRQAHRLEISPYAEMGIGDPYQQRWGAGLRAMWHLREGLSVGVDANGLGTWATQELVIAKRELHARILESRQRASLAAFAAIAPLYGDADGCHVLAAAAPQPSIGISGGPILFREGGRGGVGSGPLIRVDIGYPIAERAAAELWFTGAMESAPPAKPGDRALVGAGGGARLLVARLDPEAKIGLWLHGGAGWGFPVDGDGRHGPMGFGGALLTFQPFLARFTLGLEADAVAWRTALGMAVLPSLRCTF